MQIATVSTITAAMVAIGLTRGAHIQNHMDVQVFEDANDNALGQPIFTPYLDENLGPREEYHRVGKRGYYTCYNRQTNSISADDCQKVIDRINGLNQVLTVPNGLCMVWFQGTCMSRLCAKNGASKGLNITSDTIVGQLSGTLLNDCVKVGQDGVAGDCANMNGNCGTYRLTFEHHGNEVLGGGPN
ncbi:hypothetical protein JX265_003830 [Neoarthrinium moseri]|uniref:Uncharacterized protein n=1 Tax=Neoarthrinium moseri TaxID=1658444 RepID=A0A9P9WRA6_9PEZI|nr:hypothetical protein JX265_003830 [Neoarthrinium moseri]